MSYKKRYKNKTYDINDNCTTKATTNINGLHENTL